MKLKNIKPALIVFALLVVGSFSLFAMAQENVDGTQAVFNDSDRDGLSDDEEKIYGTDPAKADTDSDGYSDGVEVKSGFDPLKPAPGDKIVLLETLSSEAVLGESTARTQPDDKNITNKLSSNLADFIKENKDKSGEISVENLDSIIEESIGEDLMEKALPEIAESSIKIKKQDYANLTAEERAKKEKEDAMNYLTSASYILISNAPTDISSGNDVNGLTEEIMSQASNVLKGSSGSINFFEDLAGRGQLILDQMNEIEVPEKLVPTHKKGLQLAQYSIELKGNTAINLNDPMGLVVSLSKIQKILEQGASFYIDIVTEFKKYGVNVEAPAVDTNTLPATTAPVAASTATTAPAVTSGTTAPIVQ